MSMSNGILKFRSLLLLLLTYVNPENSVEFREWYEGTSPQKIEILY